MGYTSCWNRSSRHDTPVATDTGPTQFVERRARDRDVDDVLLDELLLRNVLRDPVDRCRGGRADAEDVQRHAAVARERQRGVADDLAGSDRRTASIAW